MPPQSQAQARAQAQAQAVVFRARGRDGAGEEGVHRAVMAISVSPGPGDVPGPVDKPVDKVGAAAAAVDKLDQVGAGIEGIGISNSIRAQVMYKI